MTNNKERVAIVPGSFDPITNGHMAIISKAAEQYDKVFVAVMINSQKEYMFSLPQREEITRAACSGIDNVTVISSEGWLWELARDLGACAIVKGYRNDVDLEYERNMAKFNEERYPYAKTVLIKSEDDLSTLSSTLIRERIKKGEHIENLIPHGAIEIIKNIKK